jgi:C1A family cysteine protease
MLLLILPTGFVSGQDILPFEPNDTLEEIRYKIDHNDYSFEVSDNWVFSMSSEEKSRFFSRRAPTFSRMLTADTGIGPLESRLGTVVLPQEFDWRDYNGHAYIGPIRDQAPCGSCWAFGACAAAEGTYNWAMGLSDGNCADFSESYLMWCLGSILPYSDHFGGCNNGADYDYYELLALTQAGTTPRDGVCTESNFPYQSTAPASCSPYLAYPRVLFESWHRVPCNDIDAIKTAIMTYGVVDAAVLTTSAFSSYAGGFYQDDNNTCNASPCYYATTDHAISLVGWDDNYEWNSQTAGVWILRNSWGTSWGDNGYMYIKYSSAAVSCAVCYLVYQPPATPTPTPVGYKTPTPTPSITPTPEGFQTPTPSPAPSATATPAPQSIPFTEDFEDTWSNGVPGGWTKEYLSGTTNWERAEGNGYSEPPQSHSGTYNALFYCEDYNQPITRLISPPLYFGGQTANTRLNFWLFMEEWPPDQDELSIYYRTSAGAAWNILTTLNTSIATWTEQNIDLPNPSNDYYLCFLGTANYGYGICIDDLLVTGELGAPATPTPQSYKTPSPTPTATLTPFVPPPPIPTLTPTPGTTVTPPLPTPKPTPSTSCDFQVSGGVYDRDTANPIPNAEVWLEFSDHEIYGTFTSSSDGYYSIWTCVPRAPGEVLVWASHPDYITGSAATTWGCYAYREVDIELDMTFNPSPSPTCGPAVPQPGFLLSEGDYDGDGRSDPAIFRNSTGLWAVRGVTRTHFGSVNDSPVSGDYNGDGTTDIAIFRPSAGLWAIRGISRIYYGSANEFPCPSDYNGDGIADIATFQAGSGRWAIRGITRAYYGTVGDSPVPGDYEGSGTDTIGIFRPSTGLWSLRNYSRIYFGGSEDWPLPADYNGDGISDVAIFRPWATALWAIREVTRAYFGSCVDYPLRADFNGNGTADITIFRQDYGLWAVREVTRAYFGTTGDTPVTR